MIKKVTLAAAKQGKVCGSWQDGFRAPETEGVCKGNTPIGPVQSGAQTSYGLGLWGH